MGLHVGNIDALTSIDRKMDTLEKAFASYRDPQPVSKAAEDKPAPDELDLALADLRKAVSKDPTHAPVKKTSKARPKGPTGQSVVDQSLGIQNAGLAKAADDVELYGTMASVGSMEAANGKVAKATNGQQAISKAADEDDDDEDLLGGIMI